MDFTTYTNTGSNSGGRRTIKKIKKREREGSIQGKGGLYKKLKIPTLPPKLPRSGVTFHFRLYIFSPNNRSLNLY